jgi:tetratricopeptide (TPR) repeat protein
MLADAHAAAELFTDDLIAADIWSCRNGMGSIPPGVEKEGRLIIDLNTGSINPAAQINDKKSMIDGPAAINPDAKGEAAAAFNARGDAYNGKGQFDQAIKEFNQAIKLAPNFAEAFSGRGMAYKGKGQFDQAINEFDHAIKLNPKIAEGFSGRDDAYSAKGQIDRGIQDYDQAIKLNPSVHFGLPRVRTH